MTIPHTNKKIANRIMNYGQNDGNDTMSLNSNSEYGISDPILGGPYANTLDGMSDSTFDMAMSFTLGGGSSTGSLVSHAMESPLYDSADISVDELINSYEYFHKLVADGIEIQRSRPPNREVMGRERSLSDTGLPGPFPELLPPNRPRAGTGVKRQCPAFRRNGGPGIKRGLFCCSRECCVPVTNIDKKSPYCSERCQTREQNLRQGRVRPNREAIKAKKGMLDALIALFRIDPTRALRPLSPSPILPQPAPPVPLAPAASTPTIGLVGSAHHPPVIDMAGVLPSPEFIPGGQEISPLFNSVCSLPDLINRAPHVDVTPTDGMSSADEYRLLTGSPNA